MKRVGFYLSDKKVKRLGFEGDVRDYFWENGVQLIRLDLSRSLEEQGPFDLIIHKTSDIVVKADFGSVQAQNELRVLTNYLNDHPLLPIMDRLDKVVALLNRTKVYQLVQDCQFDGGDLIFTPNFVEFTTSDVETNKKLLEYAGVHYPFVVKHTLAQSADIAHKMALIFNEQGLKDITPPCVAQTFVNHNASLHKLYVLGQECFIVNRPSIKNLYAGDQDTIYFDSQTISKPDSACSLNKLDIRDFEDNKHRPNYQVLRSLARIVREKLQLQLIGIDVIIDNNTGRYAVIDINSFPGYEGVPRFGEVLLAQIQRVMAQSSPAGKQAPAGTKSAPSGARCPHTDHILNGNAAPWASPCTYCYQSL